MDSDQLKEIYAGFKNYIFPNKEAEKLAVGRMKICVECPFYTKTRRCEKCGCFMPAKVRSETSKCPIDKW